MTPAAALCLIDRRSTLARKLRSAYPRVCEARLEDALQAALLAHCERPDLADAAWARGGEEALLRLTHTIAWRHVRGELRRHAHRRERGGLELGPLQPVDPGQERALLLRRELPAWIAAGARAAGARDHAAVEAALEDRLASGDPDGEVAARRGLRREYVNRARRHVEARLEEALSAA
jgi:hypothetical protein